MKGFKLLAIRPLKGCAEEYRKVLKENTIYKFYSDYHFETDSGKDDGDVVSVNFIKSIPVNLFSIETASEKKLHINISAVVGKNGAGKSTLFELFYLSIYTLATRNNLLFPNTKSITEEIEQTIALNPIDTIRIENLNRTQEQLNYIYNNLRVEIFYSIDESIYCLSINNNLVEQNIIEGKIEDQRNFKLISVLSQDSEYFNFDEFFYSVAVNYSIYGLNSEELGEWVSRLFHKNDAYQTPLVINPMRTKGDFDINVEATLASSRLLANLVDTNMKVKTILKGKTVDKITFEIDPKKLETLGINSLQNIINQFKKKNGLDAKELFREVYEIILGENFEIIEEKSDEIPHFEKVIQYTIRKIFKIAATYPQYNKYYIVPTIVPIPELVEYKEYLNELKNDKSHIALKLRQILNTVRFNTLREDENHRWDNNKFELSISEFVNRLNEAKNKIEKEFEPVDIIPVAFFNPKVKFNGNQSFAFLSSGELQLVHSVQSILYHLLNLNSVEQGKMKYKHINVLLDEVELYFHPEFQRLYISELIESIKILKIDDIESLNILINTHSPFILSEIPENNVLRLQKGKIAYNAEHYTFGANFYDMLADDFFLDEGVIGAFSTTKIEEILAFLNENKRPSWADDDDDVLLLIEKIGEAFLRDKLHEMFFRKFPEKLDRLEKDKQILKLKETIRLLEL